ncbi:MAG: GTP-binding protein [Nitrospira sp. SB0677_bin_15]|nr:GTP-binding protein [Nitrospira sp. SB0677_bin_15]
MVSRDSSTSSLDSQKPAGDVPATGNSVPALVVSGFLGAGKTTLVRHLLEEAQEQGVRMAVVSNEFGELGIDQALLGNQAGQHYVELEGGCVCCKLSDEFVTTLQQIREEVHPDRVVVETSGVALPFDTLLNFWREPVSEWVGECLSAVVVNAEQVAEKRDLEGTFEQQVSSADLLILNKLDLVPSDRRDQVQERVQGLAPGTPIVPAVQARVSTPVLFLPDAGNLSMRAGKPRTHEPHTHESFEAEECLIESGIDPETLVRRIQSHHVLRAKGFVQTSEGLRLVQGVGPRVDLVAPPMNPPERLLGRLVLIRRTHGAAPCDT